jgi:glycine cleavage system H lipoate-binding protein
MKMKAMKTEKRKKVAVFALEDNQCIWMKAGVVNFKLCENAFDCLNCAFDKAMNRAIEHKPEKRVSWREVRRIKPYSQKECRHMLSGRVQFRLCGNDYHCETCQFDQMLEENELQTPVGAPLIAKASGFKVADDYYYHRGHTWARVEHGGMIRIGFDDFTSKLLGPLTGINLPRLGSPVDQSDVGWSIRRQENTARFLSPMDGIVVARNHRVLDQPALAGKDPYGQGWLLVVEPRELKRNLKNLLFAEEATNWITAEAMKLENMVMSSYGTPLAATGGEIVDDIFGNVQGLKWDALVHEFLLT